MTISDFRKCHYFAARKHWKKTEGVGLSEADDGAEIARFLERNRGLSFAEAVAAEHRESLVIFSLPTAASP